ncbi:H-2 class II histocompatibility antigen, E-S beta chain-like [Hoplias malabaricus]|uniref:H-2 class II histocompatibility antigen, E-S beta chain-like n=1 Tax=Hoplias malabaricus TaxID=27720 RepID=UPI0034629AFC
MNLSLLLLLFLTLTVRTDGHYISMLNECLTSSPDLTDLEHIYSIYFNKQLALKFNSTIGMFVGFTQLGISVAQKWNSGLEVVNERMQIEYFCRPALNIVFSCFLDKTVEPKVHLRSEPATSDGHMSMLMCSAFDFFPPAIDVYWLRDGKKVTSYITPTEELADGDWYYQVHSHLEYTPKSGEKISCVVEHTSFSGPMVYDWDPSLPESERNKIAIGASGLVLGLILSAAGFIYYKKISSGQVLVPSEELMTAQQWQNIEVYNQAVESAEGAAVQVEENGAAATPINGGTQLLLRSEDLS